MDKFTIVILVLGGIIASGYLVVFLDKGLKWEGKP